MVSYTPGSMLWSALSTATEPRSSSETSWSGVGSSASGSGSGPTRVTGVGVNPPLPVAAQPPTTPIDTAVKSPLDARTAASLWSELTMTPASVTVTSPLPVTDSAWGAWRSSRQIAQGVGPVTAGPRMAAASALIALVVSPRTPAKA
jgi:hypothetical protein